MKGASHGLKSLELLIYHIVMCYITYYRLYVLFHHSQLNDRIFFIIVRSLRTHLAQSLTSWKNYSESYFTGFLRKDINQFHYTFFISFSSLMFFIPNSFCLFGITSHPFPKSLPQALHLRNPYEDTQNQEVSKLISQNNHKYILY